jgi:O-acetyl-ADP-ribose deacetylase (regulator of RNase III)
MSIVLTTSGDILDERVDAIVNAWNRNFIPWWLLLPQGVSGAIKRRGGFGPFRELSRIGVLKPGQAVLTSAGKLPFKAIIHVAALNLAWRSTPEIVRAGVENALRLADENHFASVALPLLGAGTGGLDEDAVEDIIVAGATASTFGGIVRVVRFRRAA